MVLRKLANENYIIKENSWVAWLAAKKLKVPAVAIVIGKTIHLHHASKADFLNNSRWVKHELCHIRQFKEYGYLLFMLKYVWESILHGYHNNKYEIEVRNSECE